MSIQELKIFKSLPHKSESYLILICDLDSNNTCGDRPLGTYHFSINKEKELTVVVHLNTRDKKYEGMLLSNRQDVTDSWSHNMEMLHGCLEFLKKNHKCNRCKEAYESAWEKLIFEIK